MDKIIESLEPKDLWKYFYEICKIPHPSKHEDKIIEFLCEFAEKNGFEYKKDNIGNLIIKKPAVKGFEDLKTVILQAHVDMVPQKNSNIKHDFKIDPIKLQKTGDWITAKDTTLGADNGIGVASILAVLVSNEVKHGNLEALFTVDEETGMTGAKELYERLLNGDILLNLDTEDDEEIIIGCAGGIDVDIILPVEPKRIINNKNLFSIEIKGLKGGHSGIDIDKGRANAVILMFELLKRLINKIDLKIKDFNCGSLRNAIPREAFVDFFTDADKSIIDTEVKMFEEEIKRKFKDTENEISIIVNELNPKNQIYYDFDLQMLIKQILSIPNGVISVEENFENTVRTSNNVAVVKLSDEKIVIKNLVRSSDDEEKYNIANKIKDIFKSGNVVCGGDYPGWKPEYQSDVLKIAKDVYKKLNGVEPKIKIVHAGLECGILKKKMPETEIISFGPTIKYPHSPDEKVLISSVGKYWKFLLRLLENIPCKIKHTDGL